MSSTPENIRFWNYLLHISDTLNAVDAKDAKATLIEHLNTISECSSDCDPVEHYEAYVVMKLSAAIARVIEE